MFPLNRNKQKTNRNSLIWSIFLYFFRKYRIFPFFFGCFGLFRNSLFQLFRFYNKTESFDVSIEPKQTEDLPKQLIESIFWHFFENLGLFRFVSKQFCLFRLFRYSFETPKQTKTNCNKSKFFCFWYHETNPNKTETDLVSVCFGSNRNFVCLF
jgi:hypothetical protein